MKTSMNSLNHCLQNRHIMTEIKVHYIYLYVLLQFLQINKYFEHEIKFTHELKSDNL
jgi:hypothetical protein